jgi:hypothetical protein
MSIGAAVDLPDITVSDLVREAKRWGLNQSLAQHHVQETLERLGEGAAHTENAGDLDVVAMAGQQVEKMLNSAAQADLDH